MKINIYEFNNTIIIGYQISKNDISGISLIIHNNPRLFISDAWNARNFKKININDALAMINNVNVLNNLIKLSSK